MGDPPYATILQSTGGMMMASNEMEEKTIEHGGAFKYFVGPLGCILLLLLLCVAIFNIRRVNIGPDSSWYLTNALRIYQHANFDSVNIRRPVFPACIALSFGLFGPVPQSGLLVVRLFFVLNVLFAFVFGMTLYDKWTGLTCALLIYTSYITNQASSLILLDNILPFFLMVYFCLLHVSLQKQRHGYFMLTGFFLAVCTLTKGVVACWFWLLPLCLLLHAYYRCRKCIAGIGLLYLTALLALSPWLISIVSGQTDWTILLGPMVDTDRVARIFVPVVDGTKPSGMGLYLALLKQGVNYVQFFKPYVHDLFVVWPLFPMAICYAIYESMILHRRGSALLIWACIVYSPMLVIGGTHAIQRPAQFLIFYFVLFLLTSRFVLSYAPILFEKAFSKRMQLPTLRKISCAVSLSAVGICLGMQVFAHNVHGDRFLDYVDETVTSPTQDTKVVGWFHDDIKEAGYWIIKHIPSGSSIACDWQYCHAIQFYSNLQYPVRRIQFQRYDAVQQAAHPTKHMGCPPLFIWMKKPIHGERSYKNNTICTVCEHELLEQFDEATRYFVLSKRMKFLDLYLETHPDIELVYHGPGGKIRIYHAKKKNLQSFSSFETRMDKGVVNFLQYLYQNDMEQYQFTKRCLLDNGHDNPVKQKLEQLFVGLEQGMSDMLPETFPIFVRACR